MSKKEFYLVVFDRKTGKGSYGFDECVNEIIEILRSKYFRHCSLKIAEHTILIVTEENIVDFYPSIENYIEDIVINLSETRFPMIDFADFEIFTFKVDEKRKKELIEQYNVIINYIISR